MRKMSFYLTLVTTSVRGGLASLVKKARKCLSLAGNPTNLVSRLMMSWLNGGNRDRIIISLSSVAILVGLLSTIMILGMETLVSFLKFKNPWALALLLGQVVGGFIIGLWLALIAKKLYEIPLLRLPPAGMSGEKGVTSSLLRQKLPSDTHGSMTSLARPRSRTYIDLPRVEPSAMEWVTDLYRLRTPYHRYPETPDFWIEPRRVAETQPRPPSLEDLSDQVPGPTPSGSSSGGGTTI